MTNKPEMMLRLAATRKGLSYVCNTAFLPGRPDLIFPALRLAVFMDECHANGCPRHQRPTAGRTDFWRRKVARNKVASRGSVSKLRHLGWRTSRLWEHSVRKDADKALASALRKAK